MDCAERRNPFVGQKRGRKTGGRQSHISEKRRFTYTMRPDQSDVEEIVHELSETGVTNNRTTLMAILAMGGHHMCWETEGGTEQPNVLW